MESLLHTLLLINILKLNLNPSVLTHNLLSHFYFILKNIILPYYVLSNYTIIKHYYHSSSYQINLPLLCAS